MTVSTRKDGNFPSKKSEHLFYLEGVLGIFDKVKEGKTPKSVEFFCRKDLRSDFCTRTVSSPYITLHKMVGTDSPMGIFIYIQGVGKVLFCLDGHGWVSGS